MAKKGRRLKSDEELSITSMMDMMTIILVFLLKSFSATEVNVTPSDNLRLPFSTAKEDPGVAVSVVIAKNQVLVDDVFVVPIEPIEDPKNPDQMTYQVPADERTGAQIGKLYSAFEKAADAAKNIAKIAKKREDMGFKGKVLLQVDKDIPFSLVRDIMFNAGQAQFAEFEFIVIKSGG
jgi:biopolymer transport protein ExbD